MSVNCIRCVKNQRTGLDLLCDECRDKAVAELGLRAPMCPKHTDVRMKYASGKEDFHDLKYPHWRCELWIGSGVCGATLPLEVSHAR